MSQKQCPNCGGYKLQEEVVFFDSRTGKFRDRQSGGCGTILVGLIFGPALLLIAVYSFSHSFLTASSALLVGGLLLVGGVWQIGIKMGVASPRNARRAVSYTCELCGKQFSLYPEDPWPTVTVRPDLIDKGNQALAAEAERQRQMEEAHFILHQQQHDE